MQQSIIIPKTAPARYLGMFRTGQKLHARVLNNPTQTLHFGGDRAVLDAPVTPGYIQNGHTLSSGDGLVEIQWEGPLYGRGDDANTADVQLSFSID